MATEDQIRALVKEAGGNLTPAEIGKLIEMTDTIADIEYRIATKNFEIRKRQELLAKAMRKALRKCGDKTTEVR